jgi:hypothetical protein
LAGLRCSTASRTRVTGHAFLPQRFDLDLESRANAKKYRNSEALTETYEISDRSHFTGVEPDCQVFADYALEWAMIHARTRQG